MSQLVKLLTCWLVLILVSACNRPTVALLPTATPLPTQIVPSVTPTPLPPPTVTPFPTVTPRGVAGQIETPGATPPESGVTATAMPATAEVATSTPSGPPIGAALGAVLFQADFSQGWLVIDEQTARVRLSGGQYIFEVGPYDGRYITTTAIDEADYYAEVEVYPEQCGEGGGYGLLFRYLDGANYYQITIYCNNRHSLIGRVNGSLLPSALSHGSLPDNLTADASHSIGVMTKGTSLMVFLDGQLLASADDEHLEQGDIALYVVSQSTGVTRVAFDNLEVWAVR